MDTNKRVVFSDKAGRYYEKIILLGRDSLELYEKGKRSRSSRTPTDGFTPSDLKRVAPGEGIFLQDLIQAQLEAAEKFYVLDPHSTSPGKRVAYSPEALPQDLSYPPKVSTWYTAPPQLSMFVDEFCEDRPIPTFGRLTENFDPVECFFYIVHNPDMQRRYREAKLTRTKPISASGVEVDDEKHIIAQDDEDLQKLSPMDPKAKALFTKDGRRRWYAEVAVDEDYDIKTRLQAVRAIGKTYGDEVEKLIVSGSTSNNIQISFAGGWLPERLIGQAPDIEEAEVIECESHATQLPEPPAQPAELSLEEMLS